MPDSSLIPSYVLEVVVTALFLYSAYWAFAIRKALAARLYRRQALWVGLVGAYFTWHFLFLGLVGILNCSGFCINLSFAYVAGGSFFVGLVLIIAWVDATVRVARRSDPLVRDTFHWNRLRLYVWAEVAIGAPMGSTLQFALSATSPFSLAALLALLSGAILFGAALTLSALTLLLSAIRSKDPTFRKHLKWFGLFVGLFLSATLTLFIILLLGTSAVPYLDVITVAILVASAYCLYRSARSLAPIGHLLPVDLRSAPDGGP